MRASARDTNFSFLITKTRPGLRSDGSLFKRHTHSLVGNSHFRPQIAMGERDDLGDISTMADESVIEQLFSSRPKS